MRIMLFGEAAHVHCQRYARLMQLAGCEVFVVDHTRRIPEGLDYANFLLYPRRCARFRHLLGSGLTNYAHWSLLRAQWRRIRPDICHVQWIDDRLWHCGRAGLRPLVATAWGTDINSVMDEPRGSRRRQMISDALRRLDLLIVDSVDMQSKAQRIAAAEINTVILPIGVDTRQFGTASIKRRQRWRDRLRIPYESTVFISPRRLAPNYRQAEIIRSFAAIKDDRPLCHLIIRTFGAAGTDFESNLRRLAARAAVADRVRWVGELACEELSGVYAASDVAVNFPRMDAFPVTFLECFASGIPILSNYLPSYDSNPLFPYLTLVQGDSVDALALAMDRAARRVPTLRRQAAAARADTARLYDEHVVAGLLGLAYRSLLPSHECTAQPA
jgi:glycosyltransferase involved in cell wall biosynthesis